MTDETMSDVSGKGGDAGFDEARKHLPPVVDHLSEKFPDAGREHVADVVESEFAELSSDATIPDHLAALTQHHAQDRLLAESADSTDSGSSDRADR